MNVLIIGARGLLGQSLIRTIQRETTWGVIPVTRDSLIADGTHNDFNPLNPKSWRLILDNEEGAPDAIINAAAMTDVDKCETDRETAWNTNVRLVEISADVCRRLNIPLVQISTDYVFDGSNGPYTETDTPNPVNYYGRTKLAAENVCHRSPVEHAIVRTMWLYGDSEGGRSTFVDWTLKMLAGEKDFGVVTDEIGNPTITDDLAYAIIKLLEQRKRGTYHIAGPDLQSRWEFAQEITEVFGQGGREIKPITTHDLKRTAKRPLTSGLITLKAQTALGIQPTSTISGLTLLRTIMQRQLLIQPDRPC